MPNFDIQVLRNQAAALAQNVWIWVVRAVFRVPAARLSALKGPRGEEVLPEHSDTGNCVRMGIVGPGGVDQLRVYSDCWATCGYDLMKEFNGSQLIPTRLKQVPPGLVLVRNRAFSVNYADICIRWGLYESALRFVGWPIVPGFDIAGVVVAVGEGSRYKTGDRVFGCTLFGGYSSRVITSDRFLMKMPPDMSFEEAASLPAAAGTALHAASLSGLWPRTRRGLGRNTSPTALVHSAAGGVGDMLCQVLRLRGVKVIGIVGSASKVSSCCADVVIDKSSEDWYATAKRHAPDGYTAAFDANGVATLDKSYKSLSCNGRLVVYGFHSNLPKVDGGLGMLSPWTWFWMAVDMLRMPRYDPMALTLDSKAVLGFNLSFFSKEHDLAAVYMKQLGEWVLEGQIRASPVKVFHLKDTRDAHSALQSGKTVGKMVVSI